MTPGKADLTKAHILIADHDNMIAEVLRQTLHRMGLVNITRVRSGREAVEVLKNKAVDILITEWEMQPLDGISLVRSLRQSEDARLAMLPVIMLTARAEKDDVIEARDTGITEFLVKPFTAKTLYNRLEHVIDFPRDFIVAEHYVGPDRRRIRKTGKDNERRIMPPAIVAEPKKINHVHDTDRPYRIMPSHALKKQMGIIASLTKVITPEILEEAQAQIAAFQDESLQWIAEDMAKLEQALHDVTEGYNPALEIAKEALLSLKSRAGTFGFIMASDLAFSFYGFLRNKFIPGNITHITVVKKHLEVMKIILAHKVLGEGGPLEKQLVEGLTLLVQKFQDSSEAVH